MKSCLFFEGLMIIAVLFFFPSEPRAQTVLAGWEMGQLPGGSNNFGPSPFDANTVHVSVNVGGLTRGPGVGASGNGAANAWGGNDWVATDVNAAIAAGDYATFTIQPKSGYTISFSQIAAYNVRRSSTGPTMGQWQYSTDGINFNDIGGPITWGNVTGQSGNPQNAIDLSGINALQNVTHPTTITFRIVNWGGTNQAGTWYLNDPEADTADDFVVQASTILPVELTFFQAQPLPDGSVRLWWQTASETNNAYFLVQRLVDGRHWADLAKIPGAGTTFETTRYDWIDGSPIQGVNYYRLVQVDFNGQRQYSPVVMVEVIGEFLEPIVFPNPFSENIQVLLPPDEGRGVVRVSIYDSQGNLKSTLKIENPDVELLLPTADLPAGLYILNLEINHKVFKLPLLKF